MVPLFFNGFSYTELMDTKKSLCSGKHSICVWNWPFLYFGDWFGMNQFFSFASIIIASYLILSLVVTIYFVSTNFEKETLIVNTYRK
jgi:hypothetical protein